MTSEFGLELGGRKKKKKEKKRVLINLEIDVGSSGEDGFKHLSVAPNQFWFLSIDNTYLLTYLLTSPLRF
jgi:hypothetical protein